MKKSEAHWGSFDGRSGDDASSDHFSTAAQLISQFRETDHKLRLALERDDLEHIRELGEAADALIDKMINSDFDSRDEQKALLTFLVNQFVLEGAQETGLKKLICDRLLSEI